MPNQPDGNTSRNGSIALLSGSLKHYDWGGLENIATLERRQPSGFPEAERWYGTHPSGPTFIQDQTLSSIIQEDPSPSIGSKNPGSGLPFLVKLLDSAKPLSLQVHPSKEQAREGFEREIQEQVPSEHRNYQDPNSKPEVIVALSELLAVAGFKDPLGVASLIRDLQVRELESELTLLESSARSNEKLEKVMRSWLADDQSQKLQAVSAACRGYRGSTVETRTFIDIAQRIENAFPGDVGLLIALLLNPVRLAPGQAFYTPANTLHAYIYGFGLEVMASSDNVLRCAMTSKRRDIPELLRIVDFDPSEPELFDPFRVGGYTADSFRLQMFRSNAEFKQTGPRILLVTKGTVSIGTKHYGSGDAVWLPHNTGSHKIVSECAEYAVISSPEAK